MDSPATNCQRTDEKCPRQSVHSPRKTFLLDGPMLLAPERKAALTEEMGRHLLEADAYLDQGDSIRLLRSLDYSVLNVMLCIADARHWAMQEIVAREMMEP